ncbi:hypothetical protein AB1Y20_021571 [Prymnesium parvum]|uniref:Insulysin n=2 Tax=Prymnesium parvum TaxID=97485 RepID=A0AB34JLL4_PRYPA
MVMPRLLLSSRFMLPAKLALPLVLCPFAASSPVRARLSARSTPLPGGPSHSPSGWIRALRLEASRSADVTACAIERCDDIRSGSMDQRNYRWIQIANGLQALLISDHDVEQAAAAIEVGAGHFSDPPDMPGLAHLTEHMMFLGTEEYPTEGEFKAFLAKNGGSSNAFTGMEATGYHFAVHHSQLAPALQRFASFFTGPLFRREAIEREVNAVDSEFRRNLQSDVRRLFQLTKHTSDPEHPFHKFSTGNLQTLPPNEKTEKAVRGFFRDHYHPNKMHLCVIGREPLEELEKLVLTRFGKIAPIEDPQPRAAVPRASPIVATGSAAASFSALVADAETERAVPSLQPRAAFSPAQLGGLLTAKPVREMRLLRMMWELKPEPEYRRSKDPYLLASLISSEREGSLEWLLTKQLSPPLATSVSASSMYSLSDSTIYAISMSLTPEGLERYEEVLELTHGHLRHLYECVKEDTFEEHHVAERATMAQLYFNLAEPSDPLSTVKTLASRMKNTPAAELLAQPFEWPSSTPREELLHTLELLTPERMCVLLVGAAGDYPYVEPWYGTPYNLTPLQPSLLATLRTARPCPGLHLPPPNQYVPDNFDVLPPPPHLPSARAPQRLQDSLGLRVWHLDGGAFRRPKASCLLLLRTPDAAGSACTSVLSQLFADLVNDALSTPLAASAEAGLRWGVAAHQGGLIVQASGFSQRLPLFVRELTQRIIDFQPTQERFDVSLEILSRSLRNRAVERPLWHAQYAVNHELLDQSVHYADALRFAASDCCTLSELQRHARAQLQAHFAELFVHGNLRAEDAEQLGDAWLEIVQPRRLAAGCAPLPEARLIAPGDSVRLRHVADDPAETNSAIELHLQFAQSPSAREEALLAVLAQIASKDAFNHLRTQRQLGYVVQCGVRSVARSRGLSVLIQSSVMSPPGLEKEIEAWLSKFREESLQALSPEVFDEFKEAVAKKYDQPHKTLAQECSTIWSEIVEGTHEWDRNAQVAAEARTIDHADMLLLFDTYFVAGAPQRRAIISYAFSQSHASHDNTAEIM